MGTPGYLAPEVIEGQPSSPASDVHSWGATMAYAATGRAPYGGGGDSYQTIFYRIVSGRADLSGVPAPLVPLLSAALARDPDHRPSASWLSAQASALDLSAAGPHRKKAEPPGPAPKQAARDVADLLPPVGYAPFPPPPRPAPASPARPPASPARPPAGAAQRPPGPATMAGLAIMIAAVALTLILPVAGLLVSLAVITLLRAADRAQSSLAARRSVRGPRASDLLVVVVTAPLAVARALLTDVLIAPLAFVAGAAVYVGTLALTRTLELPQAGAYAAAAVVACYGVGPGSGRPRRQLDRMAGALARTPLTAALTAIAVWALAAAAVIFAASQVPYYWPVMSPHLPSLHGWPLIGSHLPRFHAAPRLSGLVSSAAGWLLRHAHA
jgi:Protein kinase domain